MLVLRRRAHEAIVFEGGLVVTLADVVDHRAWIAFSAPSIPTPVVVASVAASVEEACIGVQSPVAVRYEKGATHLSVAEPGSSDTGAVLLLNAAVGERLVFRGLELEVASIERGRVVLDATVSGVEGVVGVSVFAVSGAEVKIGISAPDSVRVYREEVWLAMREANEAAAAWAAGDLAELAKPPAGVSTPLADGDGRS